MAFLNWTVEVEGIRLACEHMAGFGRICVSVPLASPQAAEGADGHDRYTAGLSLPTKLVPEDRYGQPDHSRAIVHPGGKPHPGNVPFEVWFSAAWRRDKEHAPTVGELREAPEDLVIEEKPLNLSSHTSNSPFTLTDPSLERLCVRTKGGYKFRPAVEEAIYRSFRPVLVAAVATAR